MTECSVGEKPRALVRHLYCGGCGEQTVSAKCRGSLRRHGVRKVHWECWSECNLECPFCYRTRGAPLNTAEAVLLLRALSTGDARAVVFAGGDSSLRADLPEIVSEALGLGLAVQLQTNAQHVNRTFLDTLLRCEYVGLSLDGPDEAIHDGFRRKPGNFRRVVWLLGQLEQRGIPASIRTVVTSVNYHRVPEIARLVAAYSNVICWKLLEFTPVGDGFLNRDQYALPPEEFERTILAAREQFRSSPPAFDVLRNVDKVGIYMMIAPHGMVYGTTELALMETGHHQYVGSVLSDHLHHLAGEIPFSPESRPDRQVPAHR